MPPKTQLGWIKRFYKTKQKFSLEIERRIARIEVDYSS